MTRKLTQETRTKISKSHTGKKQSPETKAKIRESLKKYHGLPESKIKLEKIIKDRRKLSSEEKERRYGEEWKKKISLKLTGRPICGDKCVTEPYERVRKNLKYRIWRKSILERDNYTCQICGDTDNVNVHHKIHLRTLTIKNKEKLENNDFDIPEIWDTENGITYCKECHRDQHRIKPISKKSLYNLMAYFIKELSTTKHKLPDKLERDLGYILDKIIWP